MDLPSITLSIRQPWAHLIVWGGKDVENRTWQTKFQGWVLLHASKGMTAAEYEDAMDFASRAWLRKPAPADWRPTSREDVERGGIVGVARIEGCVANSKSPWFVGDFGFVIAEARPLPFHPCKGSLGFFHVEYPKELLARAGGT